MVLKQRILISGGGSGLGMHTASYFASQGCDLVICGRREDKLLDVATTLNKRYKNIQCEYQICDLRDPESLAPMIEEITKNQPVTSLVNNAAANFLCPGENLSPNGFAAIWSVVAQGTLFLTQALGRYWIDNEIPGTVCSISTTYASGAGTYMVPSAMAKAAVEAMTRTLAVEWAKYHIRLNTVAPGFFPPEGAWSRLAPQMSEGDIQEKLTDYVPAGRYGQYEELAELIYFLLSSKGAYLTGETITIDGGLSLAGSAGPFYHEFKKFTPDQWKMFRLMAQKRSRDT